MEKRTEKAKIGLALAAGVLCFINFVSHTVVSDTCAYADMRICSVADMRKRTFQRVVNGGESDKRPFEGNSTGYEDERTYTYKLPIAGVKSLNWNPHTWSDNTDSKVMGFLNIGFFDFVLAEDGDSSLPVPEMASYVPNTKSLYQDVTGLYAGSYGVKKGESGKAFRIYLNPAAAFDDKAKTKITAADYLYSMKELLNPEMLNRRADSYYGGDFAVYNAKKYVYKEISSFDEVGLKAGKDGASGLEYLDIILESKLVNPDFYLPYYNTSTWLVHKELYEKNKIYYYTDGTKTVGTRNPNKTLSSIGSQYCTSLESSVGYGPYSLKGYGMDSYLSFERNESWYGYFDGAHKGQFQADKIYFNVIEDHKTEMLSFLSGELDEVGLDSADMEKYGSSSRVEYTPQDYTTKLTLNTDYQKLFSRGKQEGVNKTLLTVPAFRKAISLCINRDEFASAYTAAGSAGYGLLNTMYVFDPTTGQSYRSTDEGRHALCKLYGIDYGTGAKYAGLDEAYEAITGYNLKEARAEMQKAYDYATTHNEKGEVVSSGALYNGKTPVRIDMVVYSADETYAQMFNYLNASVKAACKGTDFEGKVSLTMKTDQDYYNSAYAGNVDMMFSTWGGAAYNGLGILSNVYCDDPNGQGNQMEYGFDTSSIEVEIPLDLKGTLEYENYKASLKDWADWLNNHAVTISSVGGGKALAPASEQTIELKTKVFSELESEYLSHFTAIPLYYRNTAVLRSEKTNAAAHRFVDIVGFGGVRFMTFSYDDRAWEKLDRSSFDYAK
ncbi:MAG: hypothetical protein IJ506_00085 [Clostridia bacterium]|nr:hypothetical protein [Clostridia bacterium]